MTGETDCPPTRSDEELTRDGRSSRSGLVRRAFAGVAAKRLQSAASVLEPRVGLIIGLGAHVAGYLLKSNTTTEPLGLLADLLYALGYALWTGAVVVAFTQLLPETKRRQIKRAIDHYEAGRRDEAVDKNDRTV